MQVRKIALAAALVLAASLLTLPAQAQDAPSGGTDLTVDVSGPSETPLRGETFPVRITMKNVGSAAATEVVVGSYVSDALRRESYTASDPSVVCTESEYGELRCELPSLAPGATVSIDLTFTRVMARETFIDAWISSPDPDANYENNYDGIQLDPDRTNPADVSVTMNFPEQPAPDTSFDYVSKVINRGPERAQDVKFVQSLSDRVRFVSVTSSEPTDECVLHEESYDEEGIEGGPYFYREVRCSLGEMAFATQRVITVTVVRTDPHELWSSAWVTTSSFDNNYENDWADASHIGHPSVTSDLAMTLGRSKAFALVGEDFDYTLTVTNHGPVAAPNVTVETWLPQELALRSITPADGAEPCTQDEYQGISCKIASMAPGETATYTIAVTRVRAREYWMGGSAWSENYDPDYENSYVEDNMAADKSTPADVGVTMTSPKDPAVGSNFDYQVVTTNHGPNPASDVFLAVGVPEGAEYVSASSSDPNDTCTLFEESYEDEYGMKEGSSEFAPYVYREVRCDLGTMAPGEASTVTVTATRTTEYEMWNSAWVASSTYDENYENDYAGSNSAGKARPGCGATMDSEGGDSMVVCDELAGGTSRDADHGTGGERPPGETAARRVVNAGPGDDTLVVRLSGDPKEHRKIVLRGGKGKDTIRLLVAPGTGNVTVVLRGEAGRDSLSFEAPVPGDDFKVRMFGGDGRDTCESLRADRLRRRTC